MIRVTPVFKIIQQIHIGGSDSSTDSSQQEQQIRADYDQLITENKACSLVCVCVCVKYLQA